MANDPKQTDARPTIHIVSYTHWDREFRFDFETTRMRLVDLMDNLLGIMAGNPDFKHFTLDGQFVLIDDYLEIRPEKEAELRQLAADGRLAVGPWYTLPDSSCVHGESLIRNLMTGLRRSRAFGGTMELGYNVFSFGQIAQLPQIYAGFGIDFIVFYKHMAAGRSRYPEFIWAAPDGTRALATRLGREARWNFFFAGRIPIVYDRDPWDRDWRYEWGSLGKVFHMCEPDSYASFHDIREPETSFFRQNVRKGFERALDTVKGTALPEHLLFFDGTDFTEPHPLIPGIIAAAREELGDAYRIEHSSLRDYAAAARELLPGRDLDVVQGEMRDGPVGSVHSDVCSVHPELKRANSEAENRLFRWAEPFAALAWLHGDRYPRADIDRALKYLFLAQAHDSLHGVGPQSMVDDIRNRLLQAKVIAEGAAVRAFQSLACRANTAAEDGDVFVTVYNASSFPRTEVVEAFLDLPRNAALDSIRIEDENGKPAPLHELSRADTRAGLYHPRSRNMPIHVTRFHVLFEARDIPALGYRVFRVRTRERPMYPYPHEDWDPLRIPCDRLATGPRSAENGIVRLEIAADGTLTVTHLGTGRAYEGLHYFIDSGEQGNLYFHAPPPVNRVETTLGAPARVALMIDGPLMARFRVETSLRVPARFDEAADRRSDVETQIPICSEITLRRGAGYVAVETRIENTARDHFLRVCFPTGIHAEHAYAEANFDVNAYATRPRRDGEFRAQDLTRHRQHLFVDLHDERGGFALLNDAVRDYEVVEPERGTVALSVVRGVALRIPCDNRLWMEYPGDDSAQSLGPHALRYGLYPHAGNWEEGGVYDEALAFAAPLRVAQTGRHAGTLPLSHGLLSLEAGPLVLSAVKKAEERDSIVVRLFNPTDRPCRQALRAARDIAEAWLVNLNEERLAPAPLSDTTSVDVTADAKRIVSIEIVPAPS